ncbi:MAG TPA: TIGR03668 family PPOX class F420-dependent oxidoreductase [Acidimicrobiia bacterium]
MDRAESLDRLAAARSGHLATIRPDDRPHVVVVTFALIDGFAVTAIDHKPKSTRRLQRIANIEANPVASLLVDYYDDDDWESLWWVRVDGEATIHDEGSVREQAIEALRIKYAQYEERPPEGPVIAVALDSVSSWASSE